MTIRINQHDPPRNPGNTVHTATRTVARHDPADKLSPRSNKISCREANRALYVDFEGRMQEPPALLGLLHGRHYRVLIVDRRLAPLARVALPFPHATACVRTLDAAIREVLALAFTPPRPRRVVAFSEHELRQVENHATRGAAARLADRYLNARKFFSAWRNRTQPGLDVKETTLEESGRALGCTPWPDQAFSPADAIRRLREQLANAPRHGRDPRPHTMALWLELVVYNRADCLATQYLVRYIANNAGGTHRQVPPWLAPLASHDT